MAWKRSRVQVPYGPPIKQPHSCGVVFIIRDKYLETRRFCEIEVFLETRIKPPGLAAIILVFKKSRSTIIPRDFFD